MLTYFKRLIEFSYAIITGLCCSTHPYSLMYVMVRFLTLSSISEFLVACMRLFVADTTHCRPKPNTALKPSINEYLKHILILIQILFKHLSYSKYLIILLISFKTTLHIRYHFPRILFNSLNNTLSLYCVLYTSTAIGVMQGHARDSERRQNGQ